MNPYLDLLFYILIIIIGGFILSLFIRPNMNWQRELFLGIIFDDFKRMRKALMYSGKMNEKCGGGITAAELAKKLGNGKELERAFEESVLAEYW